MLIPCNYLSSYLTVHAYVRTMPGQGTQALMSVIVANTAARKCLLTYDVSILATLKTKDVHVACAPRLGHKSFHPARKSYVRNAVSVVVWKINRTLTAGMEPLTKPGCAAPRVGCLVRRSHVLTSTNQHLVSVSLDSSSSSLALPSPVVAAAAKWYVATRV